jgi:serine/threonine-protein kinase
VAERDVASQAPRGYEVLHRLGSGQTAHVYLAEHRRFGRVALKLPRPELDQRPVLRRLFENEVMITLRLDHPRVVRALEGHPTGRDAFLALEVCSGGTLDQRLLERGRLPLAEAVRLVEDVAEGLAYTHDSKVLHRDVKPANVFLDADGRAKLGDFGTGVFVAEAAEDRVGTAFYMAPEIFEGGTPTARSDIYSLGVLAYEVLTGQRPFAGDSVDALMHAHLGGLVRDPRSLRPTLTPELVAAVRRAMARLAERRYERVAEFLEAVRAATPDVRPAVPPEEPPRRVGRTGRTRRPPTAEEPPADKGAEPSRGDPNGPTPTRGAWWRRLFGADRDDDERS